jgi:hypothetical protein
VRDPSRHLRLRAAAPFLALALAACAGTPSKPTGRTAPDLAGFLRQPVATPTSCPSGVNGSASGRRSPWVGHVDISVFLATSRPAAVRALGDRLRKTDNVRQVYFESANDAYAEYQRLYTCSAAVPRSAVPASYRLVIDQVSHGQRDALVRRIVRMPGVRDVSCDPSDPCVIAATG